MKTVLILEDNEKTASALEVAIRSIDKEIKVIKVLEFNAACVAMVIEIIDVFILDIVLTTKIPGDTSGIRFAQQIRKYERYLFTPIIFITVLADPQLYAFKNLHSFGYLEKPFLIEKAIEVIKDALKFESNQKEEDKILYFRKEGILFSISLSEIIYMEAGSHILRVCMKKDELSIPYITIKKVMEDMRTKDLIQCNRNTVINRKYIQYIDFPNRYIRLYNTDKMIEIGPTFYKRLKKEFCSV